LINVVVGDVARVGRQPMEVHFGGRKHLKCSDFHPAALPIRGGAGFLAATEMTTR
jgi:hypothetical protein